MTLDQVDTILKNGWPPPAALPDFPFGEDLRTLQALSEEKENGHVKKVVEGMNNLLAENAIGILTDGTVTADDDHLTSFVDVLHEVNGRDGVLCRHRKGLAYVRKFLRIAALYHDIGKIIQKDRHPTVGFYYITLVEQGEKNHEETDKLKAILGEADFRVLCDIVRYHDLFGVVGTGEASASVLIDSLPFRASSIDEQLLVLSLLLLTNLADIAGTIPLTAKKAGQLTSDWSRLAALLRESNGDKQQFATNLVRADQNSTFAIDRIQRILLGWPPMPTEVPEDRREHLEPWVNSFLSTEKIEDALRVTIGTQFYEFCSDFALVCKLDYALRFFHALEVAAFNEGLTPEDVIEITSALVKTLVQSYSNLTKRYDGSRRRIGIQVSGWTKTPAIRESLIKLLFSRKRELGLGWASEEASAWYLE